MLICVNLPSIFIGKGKNHLHDSRYYLDESGNFSYEIISVKVEISQTSKILRIYC